MATASIAMAVEGNNHIWYRRMTKEELAADWFGRYGRKF